MENSEDPYDFSSMGVFDWTDMRQFDTIKLEKRNSKLCPASSVSEQTEANLAWKDETNRELERIHGPGIIVVKKTLQGQYGYFCEVCKVESNSYKTTETHCSGMKHLKNVNALSVERKETYPRPQLGISKVAPAFEERLKTENLRLKDPDFGKSSQQPAQRQNDYNFDKRKDPYSRDDNHSFKRPRHQYDDNSNRDDRRWDSDRGYGREEPDRNVDRSSIPPYSRQSAPEPPVTKPAKPTPTESMMEKLNKCSVDTDEDYNLCESVLGSLLKSLKQYYVQQQNLKCSELLIEAELKVGTLKVLSSMQRK